MSAAPDPALLSDGRPPAPRAQGPTTAGGAPLPKASPMLQAMLPRLFELAETWLRHASPEQLAILARRLAALEPRRVEFLAELVLRELIDPEAAQLEVIASRTGSRTVKARTQRFEP